MAREIFKFNYEDASKKKKPIRLKITVVFNRRTEKKIAIRNGRVALTHTGRYIILYNTIGDNLI